LHQKCSKGQQTQYDRHKYDGGKKILVPQDKTMMPDTGAPAQTSEVLAQVMASRSSCAKTLEIFAPVSIISKNQGK
jgi:hypothetical protein